MIDLRWLSPLNIDGVLKAVKDCKNILIVDESRQTGSLSEEILTRLYEEGVTQPMKRLTAEDSFIPLGKAFDCTLPSVEQVVEKACSFKN
ncbi:MAG: transketolase C-terminal domain-containing protein [Pseudomonadota bacterium]